MRSDIDAAHNMLEQLSSLLRMSLEREGSQLITLRDELEFVELYLAMQGRRYAGRVKQSVRVDPELYDALIPSVLFAAHHRKCIPAWVIEAGGGRHTRC